MIEFFGFLTALFLVLFIVAMEKYCKMTDSCTADNPYLQKTLDTLMPLFICFVICGGITFLIFLKGN